jgi:hypothetical protein
MPDLNHKFQAGRMNKDLDERLVPNGEYRDALNVEVATSEGSDMGSLQTLLGNFDRSSAIIDPQNNHNFFCVGSIVNEQNDKLYWLIAGDGKDVIAEYDYHTQTVSPVVVDTFAPGTIAGNDSGRALNFDRAFLITGINIIDGLLFWTDNNTEPKRIHIERCKMGSIDFLTQTQFYTRDIQSVSEVFNYNPIGPIKHEHITVIKKPPPTAPVLEMKSYSRGDIDQDGFLGEVATTITTTDNIFINLNTGEFYEGSITIQFDPTGPGAWPEFQNGDFLTITSGDDEIRVQIDYGIPSDPSSPNWPWTGQCNIRILSGDTSLIPDANDQFHVKLEDRAPVFQFKFPRFAYRYKYEDGEYSTFSPFTEPAFLPGEFDYLPKEGYNLGMVNTLRSLAIKDFVHEKLLPDDVISIDILYKESNSPNVYTVKTIKRVKPTALISGNRYDEWNAISATDIDINDIWDSKGYVKITTEMVHAVVPSNQLLRPWDNVPRKALGQEVTGNRLIYGNYLQNYNLSNSRPFESRLLGTVPKDADIKVDIKTILKSRDIGTIAPEQYDSGLAKQYKPAKSIKTLRTYQLGVIYIDEFGRETPVFSSGDADASKKGSSIYLPKDTADQTSQLKATIRSTYPEWAKSYKFFVKETSSEYYNLAMDRFYDAEDGNIWLSFPSSERNKVDLETFLILKKEHDNDEFVPESARYKIIAIENEAPLFVKTLKKHKGSFIDGGSDIGTSATNFPLEGVQTIWLDALAFENAGWASPSPTPGAAPGGEGTFFRQDLSLFEIRLKSSSGYSQYYKIQSIGWNNGGVNGYYEITFTKPLEADINISTQTPGALGFINKYTNNELQLVRKEIENKPEHQGRFFVKIKKDINIINGIIHPSNAGTQVNVISSIRCQMINPAIGGWGPGGYATTDYAWDWYGNPTAPGFTQQRISLESQNGVSPYSFGPSGWGEAYWDSFSTNSSGWFIDGVEGFRRFKCTKKMFGTDNSHATHMSTGNWFNTLHADWNDNDFGGGSNLPNQMQLMSTSTVGCGGVNSYLGITGADFYGAVLRADTSVDGRIAPSIGIDVANNIITLSYSGIGDDDNGGNYNGNVSTTNHFEAWANDFVNDISFMNHITTPGTLWRWREDPGQIIYQTMNYDPAVGPYDNDEWLYNTWDQTQNELGVGLYNYAKIADYPWEAHDHDYWADSWVFGATAYVGAHEHFNWVSQSVGGDHTSWFNGVTIADATVAAGIAFAGHIATPLGSGLWVHQDDPSAGGWGPTSAHRKFPLMTQNWWKKTNKRRRFMFHAKSLEVDSAGERYSLGQAPHPNTGIQHFFLPTNDPYLPPHFNAGGAVLTNPATGTDASGGAYPVLPATPAPGIRPDGIPAGYSGLAPYVMNQDSGGAVAFSYTEVPPMRFSDSTQFSDPAGSVTWDIVELFSIVGELDTFSSTNPAIWETEPKEDVGLDIYHEIGQVYPIHINEKTIEQFVGPVGPDLLSNSVVTMWHPSVGFIPMQTSIGGINISTDIRVSDTGNGTVFLQSVALPGFPGSSLPLIEGLDAFQVGPLPGRRLIFTRPDGSSTEAECIGQIAGTNEYIIDKNVHNYEVTLPWFNCYSFGNGVESDRIRDDYNQVTIDNGPKASTTLEEPYLEERRSSGLIYSGIYNSLSGVNNLNQFIQAEKITKDLNPVYGSIQKLHTRNTNLLTMCEDKVFKILANKDALYNADGNVNLTATENVLGQVTPLMGEYGISKNPESFASESYRSYFTDKTRGVVIRVSQDGMTAISDVGMKDWFGDHLKLSNRLIGSFDDKKEEYNLSLDHNEYPVLQEPPLIVDAYTWYEGNRKSSGGLNPVFGPWIASGKLVVSAGLGISIGNIVIGPGIPPGTTVIGIASYGPPANNEKILTLSCTGTPGCPDVDLAFGGVGGNYWYTWVQFYGSAPIPVSTYTNYNKGIDQTISFSEISKGWSSFKSWLHEDGVSLNNTYYTIKGGQLWEHHINQTRNNFYGQQYDSSVEILFNEQSGTVKSFQTLNYEGSQSRITPDTGNPPDVVNPMPGSGEYWDNNLKTGWYVSQMYTNLQEVEQLEFRNKEGKWFAELRGEATEWLDDGKAGNIDTNEFSYQGIDEAGCTSIIQGGYTSWECQEAPTFNCNNCNIGCPGSTQTYSGMTFNSPEEFRDYLWYDAPFENLSGQGGPAGDHIHIALGWFPGGQPYDQSAFVNGVDNSAGIYFTPLNNGTVSASIVDPTAYPNAPGGPWPNPGDPGYPAQTPTFANYGEAVMWYHNNVDDTVFFLGMTWEAWQMATVGTGVVPFFSFLPAPYGTALACGGVGRGYICNEIPGLEGTYTTEAQCLSDAGSLCNPITTVTYDCNYHVLTDTWSCEDPGDGSGQYNDPDQAIALANCQAGCAPCPDGTPLNTVSVQYVTQMTTSVPGGCANPALWNNDGVAVIDVVVNNNATTWNIEYFDNSTGLSYYLDVNNPYTGSTSAVYSFFTPGRYTAMVTDNLGCVSTVEFEITCNYVPAPCVAGPYPSATGTATSPYDITSSVTNAIPDPVTGDCTGAGTTYGEISASINSFGNGTSFTIEWFYQGSSIWNDPNTYNWNGFGMSTSQLTSAVAGTNIVPGVYSYTITDNLGCDYTYETEVFCSCDPLDECCNGWQAAVNGGYAYYLDNSMPNQTYNAGDWVEYTFTLGDGTTHVIHFEMLIPGNSNFFIQYLGVPIHDNTVPGTNPQGFSQHSEFYMAYSICEEFITYDCEDLPDPNNAGQSYTMCIPLTLQSASNNFEITSGDSYTPGIGWNDNVGSSNYGYSLGYYSTFGDCCNTCGCESFSCTQTNTVVVDGTSYGPWTCYDPLDGSGVYTNMSDCNSACTNVVLPSGYDCISNACVPNFTAFWTYPDLTTCQASCGVPAESYNCTEETGVSIYDPISGFSVFYPPWTCYDPLDGTGIHSTLTDCQNQPCTKVYGCMDPLSISYDPLANTPCDSFDASSLLTTPCVSGQTGVNCCCEPPPPPPECPLVDGSSFVNTPAINATSLGVITPSPSPGQEFGTAIQTVPPSTTQWEAWSSGPSNVKTPVISPLNLLLMGASDNTTILQPKRGGIYQEIDNLTPGATYSLIIEIDSIYDPYNCGVFGYGGTSASTLWVEHGFQWQDASNQFYTGLGWSGSTTPLSMTGTFPQTLTWNFISDGSWPEVLALTYEAWCEQEIRIAHICITQVASA